jgi:hypothetical protein
MSYQMVQGVENMDTSTILYIRELQAIVASNQSDGYLKKWAQERLAYIQQRTELIVQPSDMISEDRTPVLVG